MNKTSIRESMIGSLPLRLERHHRLSLSELYVDETIFALANGILGIRGQFTEGYGDDHTFNMTFINGFFNRYRYVYEENSSQFPQTGQVLVNVIDATPMTISIGGEEVNLTDATLVSLDRVFDMSEGITKRKATYLMPSGYHITINEERLVSKTYLGLAMTRLIIETADYDGPIEIKSTLMMPKVRNIIANDPRLAQGRKHLEMTDLRIEDGVARMTAQTIASAMKVTAAFVHDVPFDLAMDGHMVIATRRDHVKPGQPVTITKTMMYETSSGVFKETIDELVGLHLTFTALHQDQKGYYDRFWKRLPVYVDNPDILLPLLYHVVQLDASGGIDSSLQIAAKGISGEGYEGHYFWDTEIYMIPFFILTNPDKAKSLLMYRYRKLHEAKEEARRLGVSHGVKIPWRTIDGTEASPYFPAGSAQIHINSDVAFSVMQYINATGDIDFLTEAGFELMVETARFIYHYGHFKDGAFHINGVTGPDEYTVLVNDNYYTNRMAKAHFEGVSTLYHQHHDQLQSAIRRLSFSDEECHLLEQAANLMTLLIDETRMIALQDRTFDTLPILDPESIPKDHHPMLLFYHPMFIYRHQISKQADAVLAMALLGEDNHRMYQNSYRHYLARTTHDSSLSKCMYAIIAYQTGDHQTGYSYWQESVRLDLDNLRNHTQHGLHVANLGGTYLILVYGLLGLKIKDMLSLSPVIQEEISSYAATILYQGRHIFIHVNDNHLMIVTDDPIDVILYGKIVSIPSSFEIDLRSV